MEEEVVLRTLAWLDVLKHRHLRHAPRVRPQLSVSHDSFERIGPSNPRITLNDTMTDEDVATRAPESDAQEVSGIEGDTKPDQGAASMGVSYPSWRYMQDTKAE